MDSLGKRLAKRLFDEIAATQPSEGKPVSTQQWDAEYREGRWDRLNKLDELAHYMVIAGYILDLKKERSVLDLGCGHGRLLEIMRSFKLGTYVGIDVSAEAVKMAKTLNAPNARFEVVDAERWDPTEKFDAVVLNEVLYYAASPRDLLTRTAKWLAPDGVVVISMFRHGNTSAMWREADALYLTLDHVAVTNGKGNTWELRALKPKAT